MNRFLIIIENLSDPLNPFIKSVNAIEDAELVLDSLYNFENHAGFVVDKETDSVIRRMMPSKMNSN